MKKHTHSMIVAVVVLITSLLGIGLYGLLVASGFYLGREHSQSEYRYMKLKGINRSNLKTMDAFKQEAWNYDSLVNDMALPIIVGTVILIAINQLKGVFV